MKIWKYPDDVAGFIEEHAGEGSISDMAERVNARFGTSFTYGSMKAYYARNKLNSGLTGRFEEGRVPENKGKTWNEYMSTEAQEKARRTQFQKGHMPHNGGTPVGTVRLRHDHKERPGSRPYYWEKVAEPDVWRMKHVVEWEKVNGPVPDGCMVTFADGDSLNWHIENLVLETRAQHAVRNRWGLRSYDRESAETAQRIADLRMAVSAKKKRRRRSRS